MFLFRFVMLIVSILSIYAWVQDGSLPWIIGASIITGYWIGALIWADDDY